MLRAWVSRYSSAKRSNSATSKGLVLARGVSFEADHLVDQEQRPSFALHVDLAEVLSEDRHADKLGGGKEDDDQRQAGPAGLRPPEEEAADGVDRQRDGDDDH